MKKITEKKAKKVLKKRGYFVDIPWNTKVITLVYNCKKKEAYKILELAFSDKSIKEPIYKAIDDAAFKYSISLRK
jgi:hypothetical protein